MYPSIKNKTLSLKNNFLWTLSGNLAYGFLQWAMLIMLARLGSPEIVGQFMLGLTLSAPIMMFANLSLRQIQGTDAEQKYSFSAYLGLRLTTITLALIAIIIITLISDYSTETRAVILIMALAKGFESVSDLLYGLFQQRLRMDYISKSLIIGGVVTLIVMTIIMLMTRNIVWVVSGMAVVWCLQLAIYDLWNLHQIGEKFKPSFHLPSLKLLALFALPMGFVSLLNSLNVNIPRYFVEVHWGEYHLGIFATLSYLIIIGNRFITALGEVIAPRLAKHLIDHNHAILRAYLARMLIFGGALGGLSVFVSWWLGYEIINLIYGAEYAAYADLFVWLMIVAALGYLAILIQYFMIAYRLFKQQLIVVIIATISLLIASYLLIPTQGLYGAAIALGVSSLLQFVISVQIVIWRNNRPA